MADFPMKEKRSVLESKYEWDINWKWTEQVITQSLEWTFYASEGVYFWVLLYYQLYMEWYTNIIY